MFLEFFDFSDELSGKTKNSRILLDILENLVSNFFPKPNHFPGKFGEKLGRTLFREKTLLERGDRAKKFKENYTVDISHERVFMTVTNI